MSWFLALCPLAGTMGDTGPPILGRLGKGSHPFGVLVPTNHESLPPVSGPSYQLYFLLPPVTTPPTNGVSIPLIACPFYQSRLLHSCLHQEVTVQAVDVIPEADPPNVKVIISDCA